MSDIVRREELEATIEARKELGADMEPALIDAFMERIEQRLVERDRERERALEGRREQRKELLLPMLGISIPMLVVAGIFTGLAGVLAVCVTLVLIAIVAGR
jgi:hypothetical protein